MRHKDTNWNLSQNPDGTTPHEHIKYALLMDIRDELKQINRVFACHNFLKIPHTLNAIRLNTAKRKRKKVLK